MVARQASTFALLPAIDVRGGRVVRLEQGRFDREQVFGDDPALVAAEFVAAGARWLHVVDLDGARSGEQRQSAAIRSVIEAAMAAGSPGEVRVQVAGGLRKAAAIDAAFAAGAARVVLGTAALRVDGFLADQVAAQGADRIAVALDIRDGQALGDGWVAGATGAPWPAALATIEAAGVRTIAVTAIARDGLMQGPDLGLLQAVVEATGADVIASGGIRSVDDLAAVRELGCAGAIIGRALYDGSLDLAGALATLEAVEAPGRPR